MMQHTHLRSLLTAALAAVVAFGAAPAARAAVALGACSVRAGAGTGKDLATGNALAACVTAAETFKDGDYTILVRARKTTPAPAPQPASLTLTGLPTTEAVVSIGWTLSGAGKVTCHLDAWTAIDCPNPFKLGATTPLKAGAHVVEFLIDGKLAKSHSWTVPDAAPAPAPDPAPTPPPSSVTPLGSLPYPVPTAIQGAGSPTYRDGDIVKGSDGIVRMAPAADPGGSGRQVYLHRIVRTDANASGTSMNASVRAEKVWIDVNRYMFPGNDYWFAFAFRPKAGEWPAPTPGMTDDEFLVMQTHSESSGATAPPISLGIHTGLNVMRWNSSWSAATQAMTPQGEVVLQQQALPAVDVWHRYVVHVRPGYLASHSPRTEVWASIGAAGWSKIADSAQLNDYNWNTGSYPRIGFYKWAGTNWSASYPTIAAYFTPLYFGSGADLLEAGKAALAGL